MIDPGLCGACRHARQVSNRRGSGFWLCGYASIDSRYRKYPPLPVVQCAAFEERGGSKESEGGEAPGTDTRSPR